MRRFFLAAALLLAALAAGCSRDPQVLSAKYIETGNKYFNRREYREASIMYRRALQKDLKSPDAYYRLGLTDLELHNWSDAARSLQRAAQLDPNNADAASKLADLYFAHYLSNQKANASDLNEVKVIADGLLKKNPKSFDGLRLSAFLALTRGDLSVAAGQFEAANQVKPRQPGVVLALCQTLLAENKRDEAEKLATDMVAHVKDYGPAYDFLYAYYMRSNQPARAEETLKAKVANLPKNGANLIELASHYYILNRKQDMSAVLNHLVSDTKTYPNAHLLAGDFYYKIRDTGSALQQYQQGEKSDTANRELYAKRQVETLILMGHKDDAAKLAADIVHRDPKDAEAVALEASLLLQNGQPKDVQKAIGDLQPLVGKFPKSHTLHYNLGLAYMAKGDNDQARIQFEQAVQSANELGLNYVQAKVALAQIQVKLGQGANAVQTADDVLSKDPANMAARMVRTLGWTSIKDYDKARQELNTIIKTNPNLREARYQLALVDFDEKHYGEAASEFEALYRAGDQRAIAGAVQSLVNNGHYDDAITLVKDQLKRAPRNVQTLLALADIELHAGKYQDAVSSYRNAVQADPDAIESYELMGQAQQKSGDLNGAIESFKAAQKVKPDDPLPALSLGVLYDATGRQDLARAQYEQVLKLQPDNPTALNNLAYMLADQKGDLDRALLMAQRATQKAPDRPEIADTLGMIYLKKSLTDEALRVFTELVGKDPGSATFRLHLAQALYQKGNKLEARKELTAAMQNKPSSAEQGEIRKLMSKIG